VQDIGAGGNGCGCDQGGGVHASWAFGGFALLLGLRRRQD
jgi:hypothetical protein